MLDIVIQFERSVSINGTIVERISINGASDSYLKGKSAKHPVVRPIQDDALRIIMKHASASKVYLCINNIFTLSFCGNE